MGNADKTRVENHIIDILNAAAAWGGAINSKRRSAQAISQARVEAGMEILQSIAANPQNSYYPSLASLTIVTHNSELPAFDGEPGIPLIVTFTGGPEVAGVPADPDEIDSYRAAPAGLDVYSGAADATRVAHDQPDANQMPSPTSGLYAIVNGYFKFTGASAKILLVKLSQAQADTSVPDVYESTIVKLAIPKLVKEGDNLSVYAQAYGQAGLMDLALIRAGETVVSPITDVATAQKGGLI
jgi:hypothetical protein